MSQKTKEPRGVAWQIVFLVTLMGLMIAIGIYAIAQETSMCPFCWKYWATMDAKGNIITIDRSAIVRNMGLIVASIIAISVAVWRGRIASQQSDAAQSQYALAERGHTTDRFQTAIQMLNGKTTEENIASLLILHDVARDDPSGFAQAILEIICGYTVRICFDDHALHKPEDIREKIDLSDMSKYRKPPRQAALALEIIPKIARFAKRVSQDKSAILPPLQGLDLSGYFLSDLNFQNSQLSGANFSGSSISKSDFSGAIMRGINLKGANINYTNFTGGNLMGCDCVASRLYQCDFTDADMSFMDATNSDFPESRFLNADLFNVNFSGADLARAINMSQNQINIAWAFQNNLPSGLTEGSIPLKQPAEQTEKR